MKLNNKGSIDVKDLVKFGSIIALFLLVAVFYISSLFGQFKKGSNDASDNKPSTYEEIEGNIETVAIKYVNEHYGVIFEEDDIVVNVDNLVKQNMIDQPKDLKNNKACKGYALVSKNKEKVVSNTYLKCSNYKTAGYQDWRIE